MSEPDDAAWHAAAGAPPSDDGFPDRDPGLPFEDSAGAPDPAEFPGPEPGDVQPAAPTDTAPVSTTPTDTPPTDTPPTDTARTDTARTDTGPTSTGPDTDPSVAASSSPALRALRGRDPVC